MTDLSPHIKALLFHNDCVIVTGLGGFVANPHSSDLNKGKLRISPPYKEVGFNSSLIKNDGLLAKELENALNISYQDANILINEFVRFINHSLVKSNQFQFDGVGLLYKDMSRNLRFRQESENNFSLSAFGLTPISAIPIKAPQQVEIETPPIIKIKKTEVEVEKPKIVAFENADEKKASINWKQITIAAACLMLLLYAIWIPTQVNTLNNEEFQVSDLNPFKETICSSYDSRNELPIVIDIPKEESVLKLPTRDLLDRQYFTTSFFEENDKNYDASRLVTIRLRDIPLAISTTKVVGNYAAIYPGMRYYIIGGCFGLESNAVSYVQKLRAEGFDAAIVDIYKGLFRVAVNAYESKEAAMLDLDPIRQKVLKDAWIAKIKA